MAGTIADLAKDTLPPDFRSIDTHKTRVVLVETGRVFSQLSRRPLRLCAALAGGSASGGAGATRHQCTIDGVVYGGNKREARTIVWAAGVRARARNG
jgi:NADH dehydrogenase